MSSTACWTARHRTRSSYQTSITANTLGTYPERQIGYPPRRASTATWTSKISAPRSQLCPSWVQIGSQMDPTPQAETENGTANTANTDENSWWALQDSNLRPLPCEMPPGSRHTYTGLIKSSQSLEITKRSSSDFRLALATFFPRLGPNWVQCLSSKHFPGRGSRGALLSVRKVAQLLSVSTAIVYRLCERGELPHLRVSHTIRVHIVDVAVYLEAHRQR